MDLKTAWLTQTRATKEFISAKTAVNALQKAREARNSGAYANAEQQIKLALATPYGRLPIFTNEAGRIYRDKGDYAAAEVQFTRADSHPDQTLDGFRDHVSMAMGQRAYARALQVIAIYTARSKTDKDFLPQLIRINFKTGHADQAIILLQRCMDYDEPRLRNACAMNAYGPDDDEWEKLPDSAKAKIQNATGKAANKLSIGSGIGDLIKSLERSGEN